MWLKTYFFNFWLRAAVLQAVGQVWALPVLHWTCSSCKDLCVLTRCALAAVSHWHFPMFWAGTFCHSGFVLLKSQRFFFPHTFAFHQQAEWFPCICSSDAFQYSAVLLLFCPNALDNCSITLVNIKAIILMQILIFPITSIFCVT